MFSDRGFLREIRKRCVKSFLDMIIATILTEKASWGYDIIAEIYEKLHVLLSPGVVYPILYSMERKGFVKSYEKNRRRFYEITDRGIKWLNQMLDAYRFTSTAVNTIFFRGISENSSINNNAVVNNRSSTVKI
ncbi:hypothetical protein DRO51_04315 [Candidatus Bathyarchaeota archaeon]|nr:MAG: hypothetical protein DRO51_04315 [Candidatus Bathyarchaeota archaeon]